MALTLNEFKERLLDYYDIELLCELLKISEEDLLDRFEDRLMMYKDNILEDWNEGYYGSSEDY